MTTPPPKPGERAEEIRQRTPEKHEKATSSIVFKYRDSGGEERSAKALKWDRKPV